MPKRLQWVLLRTAQRILSVATLAQRSPTREAAASPAEVESLRRGMMGYWVWLGSVNARGSVETANFANRTTLLCFRDDGTMLHECYEGARLIQRKQETYRLEGRNVVTTHAAFGVLRADAWSRTELRFHWYRLSTLIVLARIDPPVDEASPDAMAKRTSWRPVPLRGEA
jgi:hypothetical protein